MFILHKAATAFKKVSPLIPNVRFPNKHLWAAASGELCKCQMFLNTSKGCFFLYIVIIDGIMTLLKIKTPLFIKCK